MAVLAAPEAGSKTVHLAALDGLRGIAILLVVWYHTWEMSWLAADVHAGPFVANFNVFPETGSAGVDLFFFISGFCLFYPYARTLFDGAPKQSVAMFAYRRALKIVPSYYLAIAVLVASGAAHFASATDAFRQLAAHLTFTQTFWDDTAGTIDGVMWSLTTEASFYVLFPLICRFATRAMLPTYAILVAIAVAYRSLAAHVSNPGLALDRLPGTIDLFASGMLAAWLYRRIAVRAPKLAANRMLWLAVAASGGAGWYATLRHAFDLRYTDGWGVFWKSNVRPEFDACFVAIAVGSLLTFALWQRALANPILLFLSFVSYNLYLWHQPVARAILDHKLLFGGADVQKDPAYGLVFTLVAVAAGIALSWVLTVAFEQPLLRRKPFASAFARSGTPDAAASRERPVGAY